MTEQPMVVVRGEAMREVPPEIALFSVTVSARDKDREVTLTRLAERAAQLRSSLDDWPDAIERRETSGVQVRPELKRGGERVSAYQGSVSVTVTVTDFGVLGDMLLRLANQEQTTISGPWWQLRAGSKAGTDVRKAAITDALARAHEYAEAVGAQVDRLVEIADEGTGGGGGGMMRMAYAKGGGQEMDVELDVEPQLQTVHAAVTVRVLITEPQSLK
ncbi:SIMPL domain-containing protein [Actinoplanes sp. NPDC051494]|uniref:SIMPL domain-containing protein n=1 Tax=Actinoplanes sp. NPDC051494 TaxID=3363907 RepID=UPI0037ADF066